MVGIHVSMELHMQLFFLIGGITHAIMRDTER